MEKKSLFLSISVLIGSQTAYPVPNEVAALLGVGTIGAGVALYKKVAARINPLADLHINLLLGEGIGLGTLLALYGIYSCSAYAKYCQIDNHLDFLEFKGSWASFKGCYWHKNYLINHQMNDENFDTVLQETNCESVDFPLVTLFKKIQQFDLLFMKLREISDSALFETRLFNTLTLRKTSSFYEKLKKQRERLEALIKRVRHNISMIKKHPQWVEQWKMYQTKDVSAESIQRLIEGAKSIFAGQ